jgi:hypothetical protein
VPFALPSLPHTVRLRTQRVDVALHEVFWEVASPGQPFVVVRQELVNIDLSLASASVVYQAFDEPDSNPQPVFVDDVVLARPCAP